MASRPTRLPAIAALLRRPAVRRVRRAAARRGLAAWIVGGAIRDAALGIEVIEIDVAVSRDAEGLARDLERSGAGRSVFLSRDRPGPRVFRVAGMRVLDIAEIEGDSIESDLGRRDFTVNAIAVSLADGSIVDPFGGLADLRRRRLSCVAAENFRADPLRALRAARFYATHGLRPDRATLAAARAAPEMHSVAVERIETELSKLLASRVAAPALGWAARAGLLPGLIGRDLPPARAARLARSLRVFDNGATRRLDPEARRRLRLAHLAAHLGLSERETRRWLRDRRFPRDEADSVATLVALASAAGTLRGREDRWRWILAAGPLAAEATRLLAYLRPAERRRARGLARLARAPRRHVAVTGTDVMRWLDLSPGPAVGALLSDLAVQAASGAVKNRREARHWLSGQARNHPTPAIISEH